MVVESCEFSRDTLPRRVDTIRGIDVLQEGRLAVATCVQPNDRGQGILRGECIEEVRSVGMARDTSVVAPHLRSIGIVLHPERACGPPVSTVRAWAADAHVRILGLDTEATIGARAGWPLPTVAGDVFGRDVDLVLAMGGDGTILRALGLAAPHGTPVLGINLGRLGFMAEVDPPDLLAALVAIQAGKYRIEERVALSATSSADAEPAGAVVAYNDIVLSRAPGKGPVAIAVSMNDVLFARYVADAIIVSTPTGSTAYNFSAGGPIVSPRADTFLVTPVAPHAVFNRTLVVHPDEHLRVEVVEESARVRLEVDGQVRGELPPGAHVRVARCMSPGLVVRLDQTNFYERVRTKLRLGDPPLLLP